MKIFVTFQRIQTLFFFFFGEINLYKIHKMESVLLLRAPRTTTQAQFKEKKKKKQPRLEASCLLNPQTLALPLCISSRPNADFLHK